MQKKLITGFMLLAVVAIWGYVGYCFVGGMDEETEEFIPENEITSNDEPVKINTKQPLILNYPDPFLKTEPRAVIKQPSNAKPVLPVKKIEKEVISTPSYNWPTVQYKGLIQNQSNPQKILALVVVNGKEHIVRKGENVDGLVVNTIEKTKVEFSHEKEKREFRR